MPYLELHNNQLFQNNEIKGPWPDFETKRPLSCQKFGVFGKWTWKRGNVYTRILQTGYSYKLKKNKQANIILIKSQTKIKTNCAKTIANRDFR